MAIHPVFVHFHTGILAAVAVVALINIIFRLVFRESIQTPGTRLSKIFHEFDIFILWGNIIGFLGLIAGMITGFMEGPEFGGHWSVTALLLDPFMRFKILWSVIALEMFIMLIIVRIKVGDKIWVKTSTFLIYGITTFIGGVLMMILGAMGGIAVYGTSILQPVLDWIGIPWP